MSETPFGAVKLNARGEAKVTVVRDQFDFLLRVLDPLCAGRGAALAKTKLQEACFWAIKAICDEPENQLVQRLIAKDETEV